MMTYKGFCAAVERKCEKEKINTKGLDMNFLYQEFERTQEWRSVEKLICEKVRYFKSVA